MSNSPIMLFMCMPVPGTTTPEPAPVDAVSATAFPFPSTTEMCVVPRETDCGALSLERTRGARGRPRSLELLAHHAASASHRVGGAGPADRRTPPAAAGRSAIRMPPRDGGGLEKYSSPQKLARTGRRRMTRYSAQVPLCEAAAARTDVLHDRRRRARRCRARPRPFRRAFPVSAARSCCTSVSPRASARAVLLVDLRASGVCLRMRSRIRVQIRLAVVELDAVAGELDRGFEEVAPRQPAEGAVRGLEPSGAPGIAQDAGPM